MSRAFVKEDVDPPERSGRVRSASGLPPGAANYTTARGVEHLQEKLEALRRDRAANNPQIAELEQTLRSLTIVEPPEEPSEEIAFGARVTVQHANGALQTYRVVGVDELDFYPDAVSWISPLGRALLAAEPRGRVNLAEGESVAIVKVKYPSGIADED